LFNVATLDMKLVPRLVKAQWQRKEPRRFARKTNTAFDSGGLDREPWQPCFGFVGWAEQKMTSQDELCPVVSFDISGFEV
jgi:hypothetical protein